MTSGTRLAAAALLLIVAAGCGDGQPNTGPCDPREVACQLRLADLVAEVRGVDPFGLPPVEIIDTMTLRERYEASLADLTPEQALAFDRWGRAMVLLGLISSPEALTTGTVDVLVDTVAAFYSRETGGITIVDGGMAATSEQASFIFAHELTHYAQDIDTARGFAALEGLYTSLDANDALYHHGEGEAVVVSNLVMAHLHEGYIAEHQWTAYFSDWLASDREIIAADPDPYVQARRRLKYPVGGAYVQQAHASGRSGEMLSLWEDPITETVSWLVGYPAHLGAEAITDCDLPETPSGYVVEEDDRLGAEQLFAMLAGAEVATGGVAHAPQSWRDAMSWRGDAIRVYVEDGGDPALAAVALAFRLRLEDGAEALRLSGLLVGALPPGSEVSVEGRDVIVLAAESSMLWSGWSYPAACAGAPVSRSLSRRRLFSEERPFPRQLRPAPISL